ncbi:hypothetical protein QTO34_014045 [Cnephaeus nilssonii]|uniref:Uncharacterized protein n=1 Tax=Cnephaeus nilssonii TaxID=3371016 RepID=A0AA40I935_CNENI|nr:hypothetical protein QTO34_014045 [Eptesicus nilssonii]
MEQHFLLEDEALQQAGDSADQAAERHPPRSPLSPDSPPPICLPLAQSSSHHSDDHQPLLCSPCWQLPSVYLQYRALLAEAQSPSEESPVPPSAGLLPGVPSGAPEPRSTPPPTGAPEPWSTPPPTGAPEPRSTPPPWSFPGPCGPVPMLGRGRWTPGSLQCGACTCLERAACSASLVLSPL